MKKILRLLLFTAVLFIPALSHAVTDKEMDQARTIAAKNYLRYANNGSGYLDEISVKSMAELEKVLKPKELENLKVFKKIATPKDYAKWDKDKLVEYWSVTAFQTKGLSEEGIKGRTRTRKQLQAMSVAPPSKEQPDPQPEKKNETESPAESDPMPATETTQSDPTLSEENSMPQSLADSTLGSAEQEALLALENEAEDQEIKKEGSNSWVYILALVLLVVAIMILVVFASNVMKKNNKLTNRSDSDYDADFAEAEENYRKTIEEKDSEIAILAKKLENVNRQNSELKQKIDALGAEVSSLRKRLASSVEAPREEKADKVTATSLETLPQRHQQTTSDTEESARRGAVRTIYLGRANAKGIFVRADRHLNVGNTVYVLETQDGISGKFQVANNPEIWEMCLRIPKEYLSFGCIGPDLEDTAGMTRIVNDSPGIAVVEGGYWKVSKKARIHYD